MSQTRRRGFVVEDFRDTGVENEFVRHNQISYMDGQIQFDHDWELDTEIRVHIHTIPMANGAGNVFWEWKYYFAAIGGVIPADAGWTSGNTTVPLTAGDQYDHHVRTLFTLTPSSANASSILMFQVSRNTGVSDTYTTGKDHGTANANLAVLYIDAHYQKNSPGTATEFA